MDHFSFACGNWQESWLTTIWINKKTIVCRAIIPSNQDGRVFLNMPNRDDQGRAPGCHKIIMGDMFGLMIPKFKCIPTIMPYWYGHTMMLCNEGKSRSRKTTEVKQISQKIQWVAATLSKQNSLQLKKKEKAMYISSVKKSRPVRSSHAVLRNHKGRLPWVFCFLSNNSVNLQKFQKKKNSKVASDFPWSFT